ncbi:MAG: hypothetical protein LLF98_08285 [Clostridium sp.]|uniref:hypothetical protein n=1 Tax=Clostridium sp. TaxID=1506 RepID=UPI0025C47492|nr:hypothetical protein [Clostridium sp.]MCE5221252.1 hypothetical protein [Clostridium sp.]
MFIYILNLLHDGLKKKNNIYEYSAFEIINDTMYISELACIKRSFNYKNINDKIMDIFRVLNKYNLTDKDSIEILNMLIRNKNNSWLLEYHYKNEYNSKKVELESALRLIINNTFDKTKMIDKYI